MAFDGAVEEATTTSAADSGDCPACGGPETHFGEEGDGFFIFCFAHEPGCPVGFMCREGEGDVLRCDKCDHLEMIMRVGTSVRSWADCPACLARFGG